MVSCVCHRLRPQLHAGGKDGLEKAKSTRVPGLAAPFSRLCGDDRWQALAVPLAHVRSCLANVALSNRPPVGKALLISKT